MEFKELLEFIDAQDKRITEAFSGKLSTRQETVLARTVKLTEELGELCEEVLSFNGYQRQEKLDAYDKKNLSHEFADVIITTLLLAKSMDVDIRSALAEKIKKINERQMQQPL